MTKHPEQMFDELSVEVLKVFAGDNASGETYQAMFDLLKEVAQGDAFVCRVERTPHKYKDGVVVDSRGVHTIESSWDGSWYEISLRSKGCYAGDMYGYLTFNGKRTLPTVEDK